MSDPERALEEKVREELKIGEASSTPMREAWVTGTATALGAFIPVAPLLLSTEPWAIWTSFALAMASHFARGRGAERVHRPRPLPERHGHVPGRPGRGGGGISAGRLDRPGAVSRDRLRLGLCCQFLDAPIRFRTATHRYVASLTRGQASLPGQHRPGERGGACAAVEQCAALGIGAFRINSQILPLCTHPASGYSLDALDRKGETRAAFERAGWLARERDVRLSFHPDQFVVLNSERGEVVRSAVEELEFQAAIAELVGADTMVFHGGSVAGGSGRRWCGWSGDSIC